MLATPFIFAAAGAVMNRVRGGLFNLPAGRWLNVMAFGLMVWLFGAAPLTALLAAVGMALGQAPGWGKYIGAMGGWEEQDLEEWWPIDILIGAHRDEPQTWGTQGLVLRGMFWGACLALPLLPWPVVFGAAMPMCYSLAIVVCEALQTKNPHGDGWEWGEVFFGALLWLVLG